MKCLCGFNDNIDKKDDYGYKLEFTELEGHFTSTDKDSYHQGVNAISLHICPKCGTIKTNDWHFNGLEEEDKE